MSGTSINVSLLRPDGGEPARRRARAGARLEQTERLRPRGVGELLDTAFDVLVARFGYLFSVTLLVWLPISIAARIALRTQFVEAGFLLQFLLPVAGNALTVGMIAPVVVGFLTDDEPELGELSLRLARRFVGLVSVVLLSIFFGMPFACLCGVGIVIGLWLTSVAPTALVVEGLGPGRALSRSLWLVSGGGVSRLASFLRWLGWFVVANLLFLPTSVLAGALDAPASRSALQSFTGLRGTSFDVVLTLLSVVFVALSAAYSSTCVAVYYVDCRVRAEGLDLDLTLDRWERAS